MFFFSANKSWLLDISGSTLVMSALTTAQNVFLLAQTTGLMKQKLFPPRQFSKKRDIVLNVAQMLLYF